ncbi:MAG: methyltransferase domain-containing protein [Puia sp.]|nr:methyltransferase domain-containing protein [Puia sp.]
MDLSRRSDRTELLDRDDIPFEDIERNMRELDIINTRLGGHAITVTGFKRLLSRFDERQKQEQEQLDRQQTRTGPSGQQGRRPDPGPPEMGQQNRAPLAEIARKAHPPLLVAEIGCGGGDNLLAIRRWCRRQGRQVRFVGVDHNAHCIAVAASKFPPAEARWITADYRTLSFGDDRPDILFSSLFCHHFGNGDLVEMLRWMRAQSGTGFFINDLERNILAYRSIRLLVSLFSRSYLVKYDAPVSVLRGFRRNEWVRLFQQAGITEYTLEWRWAFRWLLVSARY